MKIDINMAENKQLITEKEFFFKLTLCTQAGTYVKEFVHGDFGRTSPNLCSILKCDVDIVALDVEVVYISKILLGSDVLNQSQFLLLCFIEISSFLL